LVSTLPPGSEPGERVLASTQLGRLRDQALSAANFSCRLAPSAAQKVL
jgi:hypothetical protein